MSNQEASSQIPITERHDESLHGCSSLALQIASCQSTAFISSSCSFLQSLPVFGLKEGFFPSFHPRSGYRTSPPPPMSRSPKIQIEMVKALLGSSLCLARVSVFCMLGLHFQTRQRLKILWSVRTSSSPLWVLSYTKSLKTLWVLSYKLATSCSHKGARFSCLSYAA